MFDALVDIVRPGQRDENGLPLQFEVVVFDPYGQETRSRRLIFESGLGDPVRVNHRIWRTSITGRFVDPFWYGQVRELRRTLGSMDKKFITAKQGPPDPDAPPAVTYEWEGEPHASPSVKRVDGEIVARNLVGNGSFTTGTTGWTTFYAGVSVDSTTGSNRLVAVANSSTALSVRYENVPVEPGQWIAGAYQITTDPGMESREQIWYFRQDGSSAGVDGGVTTEYPTPGGRQVWA